MVIFSSAAFVPQKDDNFSDQSIFLLQLSGISEIAEGMKGDGRDDIQTNEENKPSAEIMFARDFQDKRNERDENFHSGNIFFILPVFSAWIVF